MRIAVVTIGVMALCVLSSSRANPLKDVFKRETQAEEGARLCHEADKNGDKRLTVDEMYASIVANTEGRSPPRNAVEAVFDQVDNDNDGYITVKRCLELNSNPEEVMTEENQKAVAIAMFSSGDKNGDGVLNKGETVAFFTQTLGMPKDQLGMILPMIDTNRDEKVSQEEYLSFMYTARAAAQPPPSPPQ